MAGRAGLSVAAPAAARPSGPDPLALRVRTSAVFWVSGAAFGSWVGRIPDVRHGLGLTDSGLGLVLIAGPAGAFAATHLVPAWLARHGERRVLRIAAVLFPLLLLPIPYMPRPAALAAALVGLGAGSGVLNVAMNAFAAGVEARRGRTLMSGFHGWFSVGGLTGTAVAGAAARCGLGPEASMTAAGLVLAVVGAVATGRLGPARESSAAPSGMPRGDGVTVPRGDGATAPPEARRRALVLGALALICLMAEGTAANWGAVFLREHRGAPPGLDVAAYGALAGAMVVGRFLGNPVIRRWGPAATVRRAAAAGSAGLLAALVVPNLAVTVAGFAALGLGLSVLVPTFFSAAGRLPGPVGVAVSRVGVLGFAGSLAGPPIIGWLARVAGLGPAMAVPAILLLAVSALAGSTATYAARHRAPIAPRNAR